MTKAFLTGYFLKLGVPDRLLCCTLGWVPLVSHDRDKRVSERDFYSHFQCYQ